MKKSFLALLCVALLCNIIFLSSCKKDDAPAPDPTAGLKKLTTGFVPGAAAKIEVYTKTTSLATGYNKLYIALYDSISGKRIDAAKIQLMPIMDMGMMKHSAPFENPASENAVDHLFHCSAIFIMPSSAGTWTLQIKVHNNVGDKTGVITIPITVIEPLKSTMKSFTALHDGGKYFVSLIEPSSPKVGINNLEFVIFKKVSMMSFPADSSLSISFVPEMPTMGHSSPNNVNPVHIGNGHYKGKVNFTMTGLWRLNVDFLSGAAVADTTQSFDIEF